MPLSNNHFFTFFRVNRQSRWNRTNETGSNERSCRGPAWKHRVAFQGSSLTFRFELDDFEVFPSIFHSSSVRSVYDLGENNTTSFDPEMDDEHIRNMLASPLYLQEREASADMPQVYHSNEESLLPSSQSISTSAVKALCIDVTEEKIPPGIRQRQNQDASWQTKRTITLWSKIQNCEARVQNWTRWQQYSWIEPTNWDSTRGFWSYYYRVFTVQTRTLLRRIGSTRKGTSWNSY